MGLFDGFIMDQAASYLEDRLSNIFSSSAEKQDNDKKWSLSNLFSFNSTPEPEIKPEPDTGFNFDSDLIRNNQTKISLGMAIAAAYADGEDGILASGLKGIFDFAATHDIADGDSSFISDIWFAYRLGSIVSEQTDSTLAGIAAGITTYFGIDKWEDSNEKPSNFFSFK